MGRKKKGAKGKGKLVKETSGAGPPPMPEPNPAPVSRPWSFYISEPGSGSGSGVEEVKVDYSRMELVMRGVRLWRDDIRHNELSFSRNEYYRVYLENDEFVAKPLCESQFSNRFLFPYAMHRCGSRIYNLSNWLDLDASLIPDSLPSLQGESIHCHNGISWVDLNDEELIKKWHSAPSLELLRIPLQFAVLDGTIHCFKSPYTKKAKVHLDGFQVHQLPKRIPNISKYELNEKIIPDAQNNCLLLHFSDTEKHDTDMGSTMLYAWHLTSNRWDSITSLIDATTWTDGSPILVDGVLYFYTFDQPPYFSAFHLGSKRWIKVKWPTRFPPADARVETDTLFYLGNGLVCLPASRRIFTDGKFENQLFYEWGICVHLPIFHFRMEFTPVDGPVVIFTHLFTKLLEMEHLVDAVEFLPLL